LTGFIRRRVSYGIDPTIELKNQDRSVKEGGERGREESPPFIEKDTTPDDGENIGDGEVALFSSSEIDQTRDKKVIDDELNPDETKKILYPIQEEGISNRHEIEKTNKIVKPIGHRDEEELLFRNLKQKGNGQKKGKDDQAREHQAFRAS